MNYPSPLLPEPPSTWPDSCLVTSRWRIWMQLTGVSAADAIALAARYPGTRGIRRARVGLALMDGGAQSPKETWLRLVLIDGGLPRPRTQIRVSDGVDEAFIDMGYDEPMVGLDYEGVHHSDNRGQGGFNWSSQHGVVNSSVVGRQALPPVFSTRVSCGAGC